MPLVQGHEGQKAWLSTALAFTFGIVLVTGLWGAMIALAGGSLAGFFRHSENMYHIMTPVLFAMGVVMLVIALGEFGFVRKLFPEIHPVTIASPAPGTRDRAGSRYRKAAILGAIIAATFGVICPLPPYLALLVYVAIVGSVWYGILVLGAYGLGLALPTVLGGFALLPAGRSGRLAGWLTERREAIHTVQGILFAFLGGLVAWAFRII